MNQQNPEQQQTFYAFCIIADEQPAGKKQQK